MKKLIAFLCVLTLVLGMLAGCSSQSTPPTVTDKTPAQETTTDNTTPSEETPSPAADEEPVTIAYWYGNDVGEQEYTDDVEAELNKILSETPGYENIRITRDTGGIDRVVEGQRPKDREIPDPLHDTTEEEG